MLLASQSKLHPNTIQPGRHTHTGFISHTSIHARTVGRRKHTDTDKAHTHTDPHSHTHSHTESPETLKLEDGEDKEGHSLTGFRLK